jgi:hypothetical protein
MDEVGLMTPQGKLLFETRRAVLNQGREVVTVICHPMLEEEIRAGIESAQLDMDVITDEDHDPWSFSLADSNGTVVAEVQRAIVAETKIMAGTVGFICPWCEDNQELAYGGQLGDVNVDCKTCGQDVILNYVLTATASRDAPDAVLKAFDLGLKLGREKK